MIKWIEVETNLPTPNTGVRYHVYNGFLGYSEYRFATGKGYWYDEDASQEWQKVTHWAEPEPPSSARPIRLDFLSPSIESVVEGLEGIEKIYALEQGQYNPLRTLPGQNGMSAITRWVLTPNQVAMIGEGADILLEVVHVRGDLAPVRMMLLNQLNLTPGSRRRLQQYFCAQTNGGYESEI